VKYESNPGLQEEIDRRYPEWVDIFPSCGEECADCAWAFSTRKLTFWERCKVGWHLWRGNAAKYPWPVAQVKDVAILP
jgi:hypothetical protein